MLVLLWYILLLRNRRNHALADMNATKDKFFSIISHDLKNPAISQRDALQLLVRNACLWDADALTEYYHKLLHSADENVELIYNLLGWAQLQTQRITCTPGTIILSAFLPDISLIRKMAENKGINLVIDLPKDALITGDSNILATVIRNLLTNAVKFTASGGTVSLTVSPSSPFSPKYSFSVTDTGTGMSEEQMRNLFRLDKSLSHRGTAGEQGSGLGLIVCRELLQKHGSALNVESKEGLGSRFWFEV
jgi:signal transduction histidine kinase